MNRKENNKFVSDSDTKTEWEEWQQSQNRCIDEGRWRKEKMSLTGE